MSPSMPSTPLYERPANNDGMFDAHGNAAGGLGGTSAGVGGGLGIGSGVGGGINGNPNFAGQGFFSPMTKVSVERANSV